jgi:hypothetical protein
MKNLNISLNTINRVVELHQAISETEAVSAGTVNLTPVARLKMSLVNPQKRAFHKFINELSLEEKRELSALVWIGQGLCDSFESAYKNAKAVAGDGDGTAFYLEGKDLARYIPKAIDKLEKEDYFS